MADLSDQFGPVGEFMILLAGLFLLLAMHLPFRQWARRQLMRSAKLIARLYQATDERSDMLHRWTVAFQMIFWDRRGLLIIVAALIVFEYTLSGYKLLIHFLVAGPYYHGFHWEQPQGIELTYFYWISTNLIQLIGYSLFGWIALRYARGDGFDIASRFKPHATFAAAIGCFSGIIFATWNVAPALRIIGAIQYWLNEPPAYWYITNILSTVLVGLVLYGVGAFMIIRGHSKRAFYVIISGLFGYIISIQVIDWLHRVSWFTWSSQNGPAWMLSLLRQTMIFTDTTLSGIAFIALVVVLAAPGETKASAPQI